MVLGYIYIYIMLFLPVVGNNIKILMYIINPIIKKQTNNNVVNMRADIFTLSP
jgi:hypothetical protein